LRVSNPVTHYNQLFQNAWRERCGGARTSWRDDAVDCCSCLFVSLEFLC